ncbi:glycosyltransferase involved in cell wall biosynthesis [Trinickia symbiotica]|uniref:Glycosyltransferase family 1 protein n=1 Tax=Trinickia symbiotica TaxID=863227 RepID=A0A2N7X5L4_9BURK|nr:glycosyltransferase family 1 protein [Trinickia symbiotica]PMS36914.1 glycosyltransferase family 1 protein [Trinickia symbiotica]PPK45298.1 glycosyltransferase involved in cell wall biosynthesis [Trinickia symbiotica]
MRIIVDLQAAQNDSRFRGVGRYCRSLAKHMAPLAASRGHEVWLLLNGNFPDQVDSIAREFDGVVPRSRIGVFPGMAPVTETIASNAWRTRAAECLREEFLAQLRPDVVHVSSLFEGSVDDAVVSVGRGSTQLPTAITLYDLIPWTLPHLYITTPEYERYYHRKLDSLRRADLLLAISRHSAEEAVRLLPCNPAMVVNISASIDDDFAFRMHEPHHSAKVMERYGILKPFVLYMPGGFDLRKNFATLFDAYSRMPSEIRRSHQLVIGSNIKPAERAALEALIATKRLAREEVVMTGYVSDNDLVTLYSLCRVHVFPSLYEGFGLPALESLACGAPTIASNTSSLPEVIGLEDALFDPNSAQSIADKLLRTLTDELFSTRLRQHGLSRARRFSWEKSAALAMDAIERTFTSCGRPQVKSKSADELITAVLSAISPSKPSTAPTADDLVLLMRSAREAAQELAKLTQ